MACPHCGEEMKMGVLQGGSSIIDRREKPSAFPNRFNVERLDKAGWKCFYIPAVRRKKCSKIIYSYKISYQLYEIKER